MGRDTANHLPHHVLQPVRVDTAGDPAERMVQQQLLLFVIVHSQSDCRFQAGQGCCCQGQEEGQERKAVRRGASQQETFPGQLFEPGPAQHCVPHVYRRRQVRQVSVRSTYKM